MAWKPSVMTEPMITKLKEAFSMWFSDKQALLYCQLNERTFYDYCSKNPDFAELKEILKDEPKMNARAVVANKIKWWDDYNARWLLEKTDEAFNPTKKNDTNLSWSLTVWWILEEIWDKSDWLLENSDGLK